jgi:hypothetical protein
MEALHTEMFVGLGAFVVFAMMWVVLPSRLHKKNEPEEE